jgi:hypothetical protein
MATRIDRDLFDALRTHGIRKRVARTVADAAGKADKRAPEQLRRTVRDLNALLTDLESRVSGKSNTRSEAAKKAARTRQRKASQRSAAAKKGARTRAARS